jgi:hypothetical protein
MRLEGTMARTNTIFNHKKYPYGITCFRPLLLAVCGAEGVSHVLAPLRWLVQMHTD